MNYLQRLNKFLKKTERVCFYEPFEKEWVIQTHCSNIWTGETAYPMTKEVYQSLLSLAKEHRV